MFGLIIGILILVAGVTAAIFIERYKGVVLSAAMLLSIVILLLSCFTSIPTGHTGVVTVFGRVENYTLDSGIHFVAPWKTVVKMDNRVQKRTLQLSCFSSDIQEVTMSYTLNYQISKENAMTLYATIGKQYYETAIEPNIAESVKTATARYTAEGLISSRADLALEIEEILAERLMQYNIELVSTSIEDIDFTDAFTDAVEAKQVAQQNKLKAETESEQRVIEAEAAAEVKKVQAEAEAEAKKIAAEAEAYEIQVKAEAEAEANTKIADSLTDGLISYTYASRWDGQLPTVVTGEGSATILDVESLLD